MDVGRSADEKQKHQECRLEVEKSSLCDVSVENSNLKISDIQFCLLTMFARLIDTSDTMCLRWMRLWTAALE